MSSWASATRNREKPILAPAMRYRRTAPGPSATWASFQFQRTTTLDLGPMGWAQTLRWDALIPKFSTMRPCTSAQTHQNCALAFPFAPEFPFRPRRTVAGRGAFRLLLFEPRKTATHSTLLQSPWIQQTPGAYTWHIWRRTRRLSTLISSFQIATS